MKAREDTDIHMIVSMSGVQNLLLERVSMVFTAARFAQAGLVQGLSDELEDMRVPVTAIFPVGFDDATSPSDTNVSSHGCRAGGHDGSTRRQEPQELPRDVTWHAAQGQACDE